MGVSIETKSLKKKYDERVLFEDLNLQIASNEMVAIMGKSGSGKTTLINILGLIENPSSGKLLYEGSQINFDNQKETRRLLKDKVGFLFQNFALMNEKTVYDNLAVALPKKMDNKELRMLAALEQVGLDDCLDDKIFYLSGGEQQRVALARLFLKKCEIIFADEPTGSLDEKNRDEILRLLKKLQKENKTIVLVTHDMVVGKACDRIIALNTRE